MDLHQIHLQRGYGSLVFGMSREEVKAILGEPEEEERIEEGELFQTLIWHYWCFDVSIFFDLKENTRLTAIETDHHAATLWGVQVFQLPENAIIELFKENGFTDYEAEMESGEKCISFDDACADLYFTEGKLSSINFGVMMDDSEKINWPA